MNKFGYCTYNKGKLYFDDKSWAIIKALAKQTHKSPHKLVHDALRRYCKLHKKDNS